MSIFTGHMFFLPKKLLLYIYSLIVQYVLILPLREDNKINFTDLSSSHTQKCQSTTLLFFCYYEQSFWIHYTYTMASYTCFINHSSSLHTILHISSVKIMGLKRLRESYQSLSTIQLNVKILMQFH